MVPLNRGQTWPPGFPHWVKKITNYKWKRCPSDFHFLITSTLEPNEILKINSYAITPEIPHPIQWVYFYIFDDILWSRRKDWQKHLSFLIIWHESFPNQISPESSSWLRWLPVNCFPKDGGYLHLPTIKHSHSGAAKERSSCVSWKYGKRADSRLQFHSKRLLRGIWL